MPESAEKFNNSPLTHEVDPIDRYSALIVRVSLTSNYILLFTNTTFTYLLYFLGDDHWHWTTWFNAFRS